MRLPACLNMSQDLCAQIVEHNIYKAQFDIGYAANKKFMLYPYTPTLNHKRCAQEDQQIAAELTPRRESTQFSSPGVVECPSQTAQYSGLMLRLAVALQSGLALQPELTLQLWSGLQLKLRVQLRPGLW
jgi:hypothetical protein